MPLTASVPMSPPGKNSGRDHVGVGGEGEPGRRPRARAPSWRRSSSGSSKAGRKIASMQRARTCRPPPPWASWMVSSPAKRAPDRPVRNRRSAMRAYSAASAVDAAIAVIGGAGALGRHHGDAERMLRRAARAEGRAVGRLLLALQHQPGDALGRLLGARADQAEAPLGVEVRVGVGAAPARSRRSRRCRASCAAHDLEDLAHELLRRPLPSRLHRAAVLVLDLGAALLELPHAHDRRLPGCPAARSR